MSSDSDDTRSVATEQLRALGLSAYAARTFVGLVALGDATAKDVSGVVDVPRTRVYDAVKKLRDEGLVDVQQSSPRRFWPVSSETAVRHFQQAYTHRVEVLTDALDSLESQGRSSEQRGVWTVTGRETVTERVLDFVRTAEEEVVYTTDETLLEEPVTDALRRAGDRGVSIRVAEMSDSAERTFRTEVPDAEPFESLWDWSETPAGC